MSVRSPRTHTVGGSGVRYWPAGMESMTPTERVEAFKRGWWRDGTGHIITRDGRRMVESALTAQQAEAS